MYMMDYLIEQINELGGVEEASKLKGTNLLTQELQQSDIWLNREVAFPIKKYLKTNLNIYLVFEKIDNTIVVFDNDTNNFITLLSDDLLQVNDIFEHQGKLYENKDISNDFKILDTYEIKDNIINAYPKYAYDLILVRDSLVAYLYKLSPNNQNMCIHLLQDYWNDIVISVASHSHHNYTGGMLVHIVENIKLALCFSHLTPSERENMFNYIYIATTVLKTKKLSRIRSGESVIFDDLDLFLANGMEIFDNILKGEVTITDDEIIIAFIFHDIGKIYDYKHLWSTDFKYKNMGFTKYNMEMKNNFINLDESTGLYGHLMMSSLMYFEYDKRYSPEVYSHTILRYIATHHTIREHGSIVDAVTPNELIISVSDKIGSLFNSNYRYILK